MTGGGTTEAIELPWAAGLAAVAIMTFAGQRFTVGVVGFLWVGTAAYLAALNSWWGPALMAWKGWPKSVRSTTFTMEA